MLCFPSRQLCTVFPPLRLRKVPDKHALCNKEHAEKTKHYSKEKWNDLAEGMNDIFAEFALCMKKGEAASSFEVQNLVKRLQDHISENYYRCTDEILAGLGQMYVADDRFKSNIDKHAEGTADFVCAAIGSYCKSKNEN